MPTTSPRLTHWLTFASLGLAVSAASCSSSSSTAGIPSDPADQDEIGSTKGKLAAYIATGEDGSSETNYYLHVDSGEEIKLFLRQAIDADPGSMLRIWGDRTADGIDVSNYKIVESPAASGDIGSSSSPLIGATALPDRNFCVVMIDLNGVTNTVTTAAADAQFFSGPTSINAYYRENSYGQVGVTGKTYGPFPYTMAACANADTNTLATMMQAQVKAADPAVNCTQYAYIFSKTNLCAFSGLGALGSPVTPARDTWYNGSIGCVVTVQEPGHNFGMQHSSSMACPGATFADDPSTCTHSEYGDRFDPMGSGCRHMNVWQKEYQQWLGGCNSVQINSTGDFDVFPTETACNGPQALQIPMPVQRVFTRTASQGNPAGSDTLTSYYIEYRTAVGFDNGLTPAPTVLLHVGADYKTIATGTTRGGTRANNTGIHTWILDMHPAAAGATANFADAGFKVGETFTDPQGSPIITVTAMGPDKATIHVETTGTGPNVCLDGTTFVAGPADCSSAPTTGPVVDAGTIIPPPPRDAGTTPPRDAAVADASRGAGTGGATGTGTGGGAGAGGISTGAGGGVTTGTGGAGGGVSGGTGGAVATPDSGSSAGTGGAVGGLGGTSNGGSTTAPPTGSNNPVEGGCSCRVGASTPEHHGSDAGVGALVIAGLVSLRLRRRRTAAAAV
jgi:MYXO-CTERM domain-containing protein